MRGQERRARERGGGVPRGERRVGRAEPPHPRSLLGHLPGPDLHRLGESDDRGNVLCARPAPALVVAPVLDGDHLRALPDVEGADPLGSVDLVGGGRQEADPVVADRQRDLSDRLDPVDVERNPPLLGDPPDLGDRHDGADLAVRVHDSDEDRVRPERAPDVVGVDEPLSVHGQKRYPEASALEGLAGAKHGVVLDL